MNWPGNEVNSKWTTGNYVIFWNYPISYPQNTVAPFSNTIAFDQRFFYPSNTIQSPLFYSDPTIFRPSHKLAPKPDSQPKQALEQEKLIIRKSPSKSPVVEEQEELKNPLQPFKHDRNIQSNSLKLLLKYLRGEEKKRNNLCEKVINKLRIPVTAQKFYDELNRLIPPSLNYIRPMMVREIVNQENDFSKIFRICLKEFFSFYIHFMVDRPVRTNQYVRREQIKAGRKLLQNLL